MLQYTALANPSYTTGQEESPQLTYNRMENIRRQNEDLCGWPSPRVEWGPGEDVIS